MNRRALLVFGLAISASTGAFAFGSGFVPSVAEPLPRSYPHEPLDPSASQWILGTAETRASVGTRIKTGETIDPLTGQQVPVFTDDGVGDYGGTGLEAHAHLIEPGTEVHPTADVAAVQGGSSGANFGAYFNAGSQPYTTWVRYLVASERSFQLAAGESVNFAGHAYFDLPAHVGNIVASHSFDASDENSPTRTLTLGDAEGSMATTLGIRLIQAITPSGNEPDLADVFSYSVDAATGFMSITVKNTQQDLLIGSFFASSRFEGWSLASPVPELPTSLLMLSGLALLGLRGARNPAPRPDLQGPPWACSPADRG